jgi:DnaJ-class molecular chaperone
MTKAVMSPTETEALEQVVAGNICTKDWTKGWVESELSFPNPACSVCLYCGGNGYILLEPCEQCAGTGWRVTAQDLISSHSEQENKWTDMSSYKFKWTPDRGGYRGPYVVL